MGESNSTTDGRSGALNTDLYVRIIKILQFPKDIGDGVLFFHFSNDWNRPQLKSRWNLSQVLRCKHYVRPHPGDYRGRSIDSNVSQRMLLQPFQFMTEAISMPATATFQLRSQWSKKPSIWNQENRPFGIIRTTKYIYIEPWTLHSPRDTIFPLSAPNACGREVSLKCWSLKVNNFRPRVLVSR